MSNNKDFVSNMNLKSLATTQSSSMTIDLINDDVIDANGLEPVTSPIFFEKGSIPDANGLFSELIFGTTQLQRKKLMAYLPLGAKVFHPYVYEVLLRMFRNIDIIARGERSWKVVDGGFEEIKEDDPEYDESATGMSWLVENFNKVNFKKGNSYMRNERVDFINYVKKGGQVFITKYPVIPVYYRDVDNSGGKNKVPEINDLYANIIRYANSLNRETADFVSNETIHKIQLTLVEIRKMGQRLVEKKGGFFKQGVLGKNPDYGSRSVISVPLMTYVDKPGDMNVDILHSGVPVAQCCSLGFPLVTRWITEFFRKEFESKGSTYPVLTSDGKGGTKIEYKALDNPLEFYNQNYIKKKIDSYANTYSVRFEPIEVPVKNGGDTKYYLTCKGLLEPGEANNPLNSTISNRPFTWTDLFYIACVEALEDKHIYVTRYPLTDYFGTFPNKITPLSTIKTFPVKMGNRVYPNYPVVQMGLDEDTISTLFIDTLTFSNTYLKGLGGDYDGDMVSIRMCFSEEANQEANDLLFSLKHYFTIQGKLIRVVENEAVLTFYNLSTY